jgi:hypothetical protein
LPDYRFTFTFTGGAPDMLSLHLGGDDSTVLAAIQALSASTRSIGEHMAVDLSALQAAVTQVATVNDGAILLIESIATQLREMALNNVDPAALQALADQLTAESSDLAAAVVANTDTP